MDRIEQAVILAAGEGQRLRPFTSSKPKVMIRIANKPILRYVIEAVAQNGIRNIILVVGYRKEQVLDYFGSGEQLAVNIEYVEQKQQLGTAHALKQVRGKLGGNFLALSGDNIIEPVTIAELVKTKPNCVLVKEQENASKYGVIEAKGGKVTNIVEKPETQAVTGNLVNTGIYAFNTDIFDFVEHETELTSAIKQMIERGHEMGTCLTKGTWLDVVYPWDMLELNDLALAKTSPITAGTIEQGVVLKGRVSIGQGTTIRAHSYIVGPAIIGENCEIGPSVCILPSTSIGDNVCLFPFTTVANSILADGAEIGPGSTVQDSIIDRGCRIKGHFISRSDQAEVKIDNEYHQTQIGAMLGEGCSIDDAVVVSPGVIIGNRSRIRSVKLLEKNTPDDSLVV